jgi:hypothetical protein
MTVLGSVATSTAGVLVVVVHRRFSQLRDDQKPFTPCSPMAGAAEVTCLAALVALVAALVFVSS